MKSQTFKHYKDEKYEWGIFLSLLSLTLFGFYKNGLSYFFLGKLNILEALNPLIYPSLSIGVCLLICFFRKEKISKNSIFLAMILGLMASPRFPVIYYFFSCFFFFLFVPKLQVKLPWFNWLALFGCFMVFMSQSLAIGFENIIEVSTPYLYGTVDDFLGKSVGMVGTTSIFLLGILWFLFSQKFYYKKEIPFFGILSYSICFLIFFILGLCQMRDFFQSTFFFPLIVLLPENKTSPAEIKWQRIYGFLFGISSFFILNIFHFTFGSFYLVIGFNVLNYLLFFFEQKKYDKIS